MKFVLWICGIVAAAGLFAGGGGGVMLEWMGKKKVVNHHNDVPFHVLERKYYPFYCDPKTGRVSLDAFDGAVMVLPRLSDGSDGRWRWGKDTASERVQELIAQKVKGRGEYGIFQMELKGYQQHVLGELKD